MHYSNNFWTANKIVSIRWSTSPLGTKAQPQSPPQQKLLRLQLGIKPFQHTAWFVSYTPNFVRTPRFLDPELSYCCANCWPLILIQGLAGGTWPWPSLWTCGRQMEALLSTGGRREEKIFSSMVGLLLSILDDSDVGQLQRITFYGKVREQWVQQGWSWSCCKVFYYLWQNWAKMQFRLPESIFLLNWKLTNVKCQILIQYLRQSANQSQSQGLDLRSWAQNRHRVQMTQSQVRRRRRRAWSCWVARKWIWGSVWWTLPQVGF